MTDRVRQLGDSGGKVPDQTEPPVRQSSQADGGAGADAGRSSGKSVCWYRRAQGTLIAVGLATTIALAVFPIASAANSYLVAVAPALTCILVALAVLTILAERKVEALRSKLEYAEQLVELNSSVIASFAMAVDAKDQHTHGHTQRVRDLAVVIGREMGLSEQQLEALRMAAMLHDIGKLAVPDYILSKPDQLSPEEMKKVQTHTLVGAALLESVKFPCPVVPIIRSHHEWYDGRGYPDGLSGEAIPLGARILAVADVYDALLSHRPYRPAMTVQEAMAFMRDRSGTQFDPKVVETCFQVLSEKQVCNRFGFIFGTDGALLAGDESEDGTQLSVYTDIKQAHQELLALYEIVQSVSQSLDLGEILEAVLAKTKRIVDYCTCLLFLTQNGSSDLVVDTAVGAHAELFRGRRLPMGEGLSGAVAQSGKQSGPGKEAQEDLTHLLGPAAAQSPLRYALSVPLTTEEGCTGALTLYRADDRPFDENDARLASAVARQIAIAIRNAGQFERTKKSALTDQLTGLANARYFFMHLEQELNRAQREQRTVSLIAVDLDGLKQINDNFGHQQGDRALQAIAEVFRRYVRNYDTVVRYAGDEFFIILPDTTNQLAVETANRIKRAVRETSLEVLPNQYINLSASFGVATFPGDAREAETLIAVADRAMYADKRLNQQTALLSAERKGDRTDKQTSTRLPVRRS